MNTPQRETSLAKYVVIPPTSVRRLDRYDGHHVTYHYRLSQSHSRTCWRNMTRAKALTRFSSVRWVQKSPQRSAERVLGGVAFGIISKSAKPVLVLPIEKMPGDNDACEPVARCGFSDHVLFATDFSDAADHAFIYVQRMVAKGVRAVTLIHVQDKEHIYGDLEAKLDDFNQIDRERLELLESRLKEMGPVEVNIEIPYGLAKQEIIQHIDPENLSMIVMGTQGRGFFGEFFLGSVAAHVARRSSVPTLLIPPLR